jgi:hypothetical protein
MSASSTLVGIFRLIPDYRTVEPKDGDEDGDGRGGLPGIPTSVVNGTAPQPQVSLKLIQCQENRTFQG